MVKDKDETPDQPKDFWADVVKNALIHQWIGVEVYSCQKCNKVQVHAHRGVETMTCGDCGHTQASAMPREPVDGEVTLNSINMSKNIMKFNAVEAQKEFPPINPKELSKLPAETRVYLARYREQIVLQTLEKTTAMASAMSGETE